MPNYGTPQAGGVLTVVNAGDPGFIMWNAETPPAGTRSIAFNRGSDPVAGEPYGIVFSLSFAAAEPVAVLDIQASNDGVNWVTIATMGMVQQDYYADLGQFAFYSALLVSQSAGGAITLIAQR
jgi:hypothetical protein